VRLSALIIDFLFVPNLNYKEIVGLQHLPMWRRRAEAALRESEQQMALAANPRGGAGNGSSTMETGPRNAR
jgi:hypothetical protein